MSEDRVFLDTNIIIYAYDISAVTKHEIANELLINLWDQGLAVISTQVLQEFFVNVTQKIPEPLDIKIARDIINGVVRQEFRYVTISGSFRKHLDYILKVKKILESTGTEVLSPRFTEPKNPGDTFVVFVGEEGKTPLQLERHHLSSIEKSDALIVCSPKGYVGASGMLEVGYANALNKRIIFTEKPEEFILNALPAEVGL